MELMNVFKQNSHTESGSNGTISACIFGSYSLWRLFYKEKNVHLYTNTIFYNAHTSTRISSKHTILNMTERPKSCHLHLSVNAIYPSAAPTGLNLCNRQRELWREWERLRNSTGIYGVSVSPFKCSCSNGTQRHQSPSTFHRPGYK